MEAPILDIDRFNLVGPTRTSGSMFGERGAHSFHIREYQGPTRVLPDQRVKYHGLKEGEA